MAHCMSSFSDLTALSLNEASQGLANGDFTSIELTEASLDRIAALDPLIKSYISVTGERALEQAHAADAARSGESDHPLLGVPIAVKDVISTANIETTCGSRMLKGYLPPYTATVVNRLDAAGAVMLGKTNTDEFAMGSSTENSAFFTTHNPWCLERVPGGSSGGSAAAVASSMAFAALGSDTGGSIRQPGAFCGVVGLKPSYGRVSRYGLVAFGSSLDQIGVFARTVGDAALMLETIAGVDSLDSTSLDAKVPAYSQHLEQDLHGLRLGIPEQYFGDGMQTEVKEAVQLAIKQFEQLGAELISISMPHTEMGLPVYYMVVTAECSANLSRFDGIRFGHSTQAGSMWGNISATRAEGFGPEVKRRIMLGTYALSVGYYDAYYLKAQQVRTLIKEDFAQAFEKVDLIACPTTPTTAFPIGEKVDDPLSMYLADIFTISANLSGNCGVSVPCGYDSRGLPIGLQLMGPYLGEEILLQAAYAYESHTEWHLRRPILACASGPA